MIMDACLFTATDTGSDCHGDTLITMVIESFNSLLKKVMATTIFIFGGIELYFTTNYVLSITYHPTDIHHLSVLHRP